MKKSSEMLDVGDVKYGLMCLHLAGVQLCFVISVVFLVLRVDGCLVDFAFSAQL